MPRSRTILAKSRGTYHTRSTIPATSKRVSARPHARPASCQTKNTAGIDSTASGSAAHRQSQETRRKSAASDWVMGPFFGDRLDLISLATISQLPAAPGSLVRYLAVSEAGRSARRYSTS